MRFLVDAQLPPALARRLEAVGHVAEHVTTAIFTLIHPVMLKSLPVTDPSSLYRIGDGDNCCVQGSPRAVGVL